MDWQPIETAPKDGTAFLAYFPKTGPWNPRKIESVTYADTNRYFLTGLGHEMSRQPTHWMPLPEPPEQA